MTTGKKLAIGGLIVVGITTYMAYLGASSSWQYYLTADECLDDASKLFGERLRVNGKIVANSLQIAADRKQAVFSLEGHEADLPVVCSGPLPDNLAENIDVVVEGSLDETGVLRGDKLLTRCASKYDAQPPTTPRTAVRTDAEKKI